MAKFLFLYRNPPMPANVAPSPEEIQGILTAWHAWFATVGAALVDGGDGLQDTGRTVRPGGVVSDGPFIEAKELVGGYSIIQAESYEHAVVHAKTCPVLAAGGWVEVRELAGFN
jgi:hypothetical protein